MNIRNNDLRQNLNWEKEVLNELKGDLKDEKLLVNQSYDKKLTKEEKEALEKVVVEQEDQRIKT